MTDNIDKPIDEQYPDPNDNPANWASMPKQFKIVHKLIQDGTNRRCNEPEVLNMKIGKWMQCTNMSDEVCQICNKTFCSAHIDTMDNEITRELIDTDDRFTRQSRINMCYRCLQNEREIREEHCWGI